MDRDFHAFGGFGLLGECAGPADPRDDALELGVEVEPVKVRLDDSSVPRRHSREDLVQGCFPSHFVNLLEDHGRELPVALREDLVGALGQREEKGGPAAGPAFRLADDEAVALEVGEVLANRIGGDAQVGRDRFGAGVAFAPKELEHLHAGRTAGDHLRHIRSLAADPTTAPIYYRWSLTKSRAGLNS